MKVAARVKASDVPPGVDPATYTPAVKMMPKGSVATFMLKKGQVLTLEALPESAFEQADLTGSLVLAKKKVAVFSGHESAAIVAPQTGPPPGPDEQSTSGCLDHLEEQILPTELLGKSYLAGKSKSRGGEPDLWRVVAAEDNVTITTVPHIEGLDGTVLSKAGDFAEAFTKDSFEIATTGPTIVGQYFVGQAGTDTGIGDPDLIVAIPVERFRSTYAIMVPPSYAKNYVTVIRKAGSEIKIDGVAVDSGYFDTFGSGTWEVGPLELKGGLHVITGVEAFGLSAYGYDSAAGYGYPGGLTIPGEANP